jgi:hypothetical protein
MSMFKESRRQFTDPQPYPCPACRCGTLTPITLTEALGCEICRHIFTLDMEQHLLKMVDREPPITWRWTGQNWRGQHIGQLEINWIYWFLGCVLVLMPPGLIAVSGLLFPPVSGSAWVWFPLIWASITLIAHLTMVIWMVTEAYQFPLLLYLRTRWQQLWRVSHS